MVDGGATGDGGTGDWGSPAGTNMSPTHENCVVVEPPGNAGILTAPDGSSYVLLPRQPARPEEDLSGGPPGPRDSTAVT